MSRKRTDNETAEFALLGRHSLRRKPAQEIERLALLFENLVHFISPATKLSVNLSSRPSRPAALSSNFPAAQRRSSARAAFLQWLLPRDQAQRRAASRQLLLSEAPA